jgi:hypothetical protein
MSRTRLLVATIVALAGTLAACDGGGTNTPTGRTRILLTDAPFPYDRIARVDMHIVRVQVSTSPDTSQGTEAGWTTIAEPNRTINLLELHSGETTLLGETDFSASSVSAVRVVVNTAQSSVTDVNGQPVLVRWPIQGEIGVHALVEGSLALFAEGTPHNLVIDFDVGRSFSSDLGDGSLVFIPWIRALDDAGAGAISGVVRGTPTGASGLQPLANVAVTVLAGDPNANPMTWYKIATGKTDAQGRYKVAYILHGQVIVRAEPLVHSSVGCMDTKNVVVSNGETTTLNLDLPASPGTCARFTGSGGGPDTSGTGTPGGTPTGGPVASVAVTVWPQTPAVGDSVGAYANLANAQGTSLYNRSVSWSVSDTTVIGITGAFGQSVILRPKKAGTATITATSEGVQGSRTVNVQ